MALSSKHLLVAAGVTTIAVGAAWYLSSKRRRSPKASLPNAAALCTDELGTRISLKDPLPPQPPQRRRSGESVVDDDTPWQLKGKFAAFCSHYKKECAMEARHCQFDLEQMLGAPCFLDSDDLTDLRKLLQHVAHSDVLLLFQSANVLTRPFCLLELNAAIAAKVPIIAINVRGGNEYSFDDTTHFLRYLDVELELRNPDAGNARGVVGIKGWAEVDLTPMCVTLVSTSPHGRQAADPARHRYDTSGVHAVDGGAQPDLDRLQPIRLPQRAARLSAGHHQGHAHGRALYARCGGPDQGGVAGGTRQPARPRSSSHRHARAWEDTVDGRSPSGARAARGADATRYP
eukprot:scaffold31608_cov63-Phaeocystis_antarctica.AAC.3